MRVLWFTTAVMPEACKRAGHSPTGSGYWVSSLLDHLAGMDGIRVCVTTATPHCPDLHFEHNGIEYVVIHQSRRERFTLTPKKSLFRCQQILDWWAPDIVHIHGTEYFYGLLLTRRRSTVPTIVSLQGLLGPYTYRNLGGLSLREVLAAQRITEALRGSGILWDQYRMQRNAKREKAILQACRAVAGRTDWDRLHATHVNPSLTYCNVGEILRPEFHEHRWRLEACQRHTILFTNVGCPRRGTETLLDAFEAIANDFPGTTLRLAGHINPKRGYHRFLLRRINESPMRDRLSLLGYIDGTGMANELGKCHVFVLPSFLENSPNSLCEAMLMGVPCIAACSGGVGSLIEDQQSGLIVPRGNPQRLASALKRVFEDDTLSQRISERAHEVARERHNPSTIIEQLIEAYEQTIRTYGLRLNASGDKSCSICTKTLAFF